MSDNRIAPSPEDGKERPSMVLPRSEETYISFNEEDELCITQSDDGGHPQYVILNSEQVREIIKFFHDHQGE